MPRYVAFLRALNVGGASTVRMEVLRRIFEGAGFSAVSTYIASGNVIFSTTARSAAALEQRIEKALIEALGFEATPFVRTGPELAGIVGFKAFPAARVAPADQLAIVFLSTPPGAGSESALQALRSPTDEFRIRGREIYWLRHRTPDGLVYSTTPLEKLLDQPFTIRSLNTVKKISERYFADG